jgi:nucleoside phosphorylase
LLTVNKHETEQVQLAFGRSKPAVHVGRRAYWDYGDIGGARVVHAMTNMGDVATIAAVQDAAETLHPVLFLAVGVAWGAGLKGQQIGDLLLANPLRDAAHHKDDAEKGIRPRGHHFELDDSLLQNLKTHHRDWVRQQPEPLKPEPVDMGEGLWRNPRPQLLDGLVLSLPVLIDNQATRDRFLAAHSGAIGGEMEGRGLGFAVLAEKCDMLLIKAICDWAAAKNANEAQKERDQQLAATRAADFVRYAVERSLGPWAVHERQQWLARAGTAPAPVPAGPTGVNIQVMNNDGIVAGTIQTLNFTPGKGSAS